MPSMDVQAKLTLDTAGFEGPAKRAQDTISKTAELTAKNARKSAEAQAAAAKFAGDVITEQTRRQLEANKNLSVASNEYRQIQTFVLSGALKGAEADNAQAAVLQKLTAARMAAAKAAQTQEHAEVSQRMAASAAVRGLENGNVGIRSVENFLTTIPGVGAALQNIFPILGATAFVGMLVEMGVRGFEAFQKIRDAAKDTQRAFDELHDKDRIQIDDLEIQDQKIQDQIDKLSGHPNNGMATSLLEAKKRADELLTSLQADRKELEQLFKEHSVGSFQGWLRGLSGTGAQEKNVLNDMDSLESELRNAKTPKDRQAAFAKWIGRYQGEIGRLQGEQAGSQRNASLDSMAADAGQGMVGALRPIGNSAKIGELQTVIRKLQDRAETDSLGESIAAGQGKLGGLKQSKSLEEQARKAAEAQMHGYQEGASKLKLQFASDHDEMVTQEMLFWENIANSAKLLPENRREVLAQLASSTAEFYRALDSEAKKAIEEQAKFAREEKQSFEELTRMMNEWDKELAAISNAESELAAGRQKNSDLMAEWTVKQKEATGELSRHDAVMQIAALHAADYAAQLAKIQQERDANAANGGIDENERRKRDLDLQRRAVDVTGQRDRTAAADQLAAYQATAAGAAATALQEFAVRVTDTSRLLADTVMNTLNHANQTLLKVMTEKSWQRRGAGKELGKGIFTDIAGKGLEYGEGSIMKALRLSKTKPDGTQENPMWVRMVGQIPGQGTNPLSSLMQGASSIAPESHMLSTLLSFIPIPGFAEGGDVAAGTTAWVGERGPELVHFGSSAHVTPNHKLGGASGMHIGDVHIDARGATDPAAIEAAAHRGYQAAVQTSVSASRYIAAQDQRRVPSLARR